MTATGTSSAASAAAASDGSVTFSLKELMRLEDERVASEREEQRRREEARARDEGDRARRAEDEARAARQAEQARWRDEEQRAREEAARLDGMQRAIVERERLVAQHAARDAEVARLRAHELELARMKHVKVGAAGVPWAAAATSSLALIAAIALHYAVLSPAADHRVEEARADARRSTAVIAAAQTRVAELGQRVGALDEELRKANDRADKLQKDLDDARKKAEGRGAAFPSGAGPKVVTENTGAQKKRDLGFGHGGPCAKGDPLCD